MPVSDTTVKVRADIRDLQAGMQAAQRSVRLATSEFAKQTAGLDNWAKSEKGLEEKVKQLNTTLAAQKKQVELAREALTKTEQAYGKNSAEADRARMRLNGYEKEVAQTEKSLEYYGKQLDDCRNKTGDFVEVTEESADAMKKASDGFTVAKGILADLVANGIRWAISELKDLASEAITVGANFESSMSKVQAISGANAEEIQALTDKAREMGAKTVFSASEASAAFQYMAMAGWETEDMLNGIEGIMNLAAASGEDLATTSDIVTDALTAMGYSAGEAGHLADVMAAASSNANTNVGLMGETFQYAAPLVGALGFNMEDTAAAIGLMANSGIKGQKAGTALRGILTNLSAPTETVASGMEKVGVSLTDAEGNMKSLREVMTEMRKGFADLSEVEKAEAASQIAGKNAMSGLLAIVNASEADFNKLTAAVDGSAGASQKMADIMNDNVSGQLTLLKSQVEGIMIDLFNRASGSMRGGIQAVSDALDEVDWDVVGDAVGRFAEKVLDVFVWLIKNGDVILETLKSVAKVMATIWVVKKAAAFADVLNGVIVSVRTFATAIKAGGSAMAAAGQAGGLFASLVSPAGAIVLGIAAVVAVTASLISIFGEEEQAIRVLTEEQEANIQKSAEMASAYRDMEAQRQESMKSVQDEYMRYDDLLGELDSLVTANGEVKAGYEDRVAFILNELNSALGTEMQLTDGVIQNYAAERAELEKLLETKRAEAILSANEAAYTEAYSKRAEAAEQYAKAQNDFNDTLERAQQKQSEVNAIMAEYNRLMTEKGIEAALDYKYANQQTIDEMEGLKVAVSETRASLIDASQAYEGYNQTIKNYEGLSSAIISGDQQKIDEALMRTENALKDHSTATADELKMQADAYRAKYEEMVRAVNENGAQISEAELENAKKLAELTEKEYEESGKKSQAGYHKGLSNKQGLADVANAAATMGADSVNSLDNAIDAHSPSRKTYQSGVYFIEGFVNGMSDNDSRVYRKAYEIAQKAINGLKKGQQEGSPSKITFKSGVYFVQGYINGIASMTKSLTATVKKSLKTMLRDSLKVSNGNFSELASAAAEGFSETLSEKMKFTLAKIQYQNQEKLKEFDATTTALNEKMSATKDENAKKQYKAQIDAQNKAKQAYQTASQQMLSEYTAAMNDYQKQAQNLIQSTIGGIASKYQTQYDALISKQNNLITKLRTAGNLFDISGAGVMTINDITAQTKEIKDYTKKLQQIKSKVSADLFDEIAELDMTEGNAFIDRLLGMSTKELKAYSDAYDEKLKASESMAAKVYKSDLNATTKAYKEELTKAFKKLPAELEKLGTQAMKGFVSGLTTDTSYMSKEIKTFVKSMVSQFKKDLKIKSPSRIMAEIGGFTGDGFVEGLKEKIKDAEDAARAMASAVVTPSSDARMGGGGGGGNVVNNNYNLVQNNTSPLPLTALETFRARKRQVQMVKALT